MEPSAVRLCCPRYPTVGISCYIVFFIFGPISPISFRFFPWSYSQSFVVLSIPKFILDTDDIGKIFVWKTGKSSSHILVIRYRRLFIGIPYSRQNICMEIVLLWYCFVVFFSGTMIFVYLIRKIMQNHIIAVFQFHVRVL